MLRNVKKTFRASEAQRKNRSFKSVFVAKLH